MSHFFNKLNNYLRLVAKVVRFKEKEVAKATALTRLLDFPNESSQQKGEEKFSNNNSRSIIYQTTHGLIIKI